ncbi:MAG: hypothetical protein A2940_01040 [Candidatus Wildermuthbacteria bacterium RIFCSPLOWO2_01_FULL_48_29]|uniref:Uncharacterized protein n=2 Tax=Candidatus Wildermuthiibacteriota TaxID=1817923 RepID=A0A1G2RKC2_9BACT|nr:MAG: hypothetical protein A2843_01145 [Candidatus Wildermuthbacteria bacterium RIFCSPHIGHO2_01_FULL_48_27b]OHA73295.1 MAG: hypothetical protein A2940_01040 [Candidatus Wildermuthbacteria bacterium RIFCSPLOWO2_01_FULL_48_29]
MLAKCIPGFKNAYGFGLPRLGKAGLLLVVAHVFHQIFQQRIAQMRKFRAQRIFNFNKLCFICRGIRECRKILIPYERMIIDLREAKPLKGIADFRQPE